MPRPDCNLLRYEHLSDRKNTGGEKTPPAPVHLPFFLATKYPTDLRTIKVTEESYKLLFTKQDGVKNGRFMNRYGVENLLCLEFDMKIRSVDVERMLLGGIFVCGE